jgi:plasmid stabilization system protein ParE
VNGDSLRIHPAALDEAEAALAWYGMRSSKAAEAFLVELNRMVVQISQHPGQYPLSEFKTRKAVLQRFPYVIVFREGTEGIEIVAVAHGRRRPGYWRDRL